MESELQADLIDALGGIDPLELLIDDPELAAIAQDIGDDGSSILLTDNFVKDVNSKQRARKKYNKNTKSKSYICVVCGATAKGYYYYGAIVCSSCRAFFKRSIQGDMYKNFLCQQGNETCTIDSKSWHSCQLCRFNICLKQGMVIPGNDTDSEISCSYYDGPPDTSLVLARTSIDENQGRRAMYLFLKDRMKQHLSRKLNNLLSPCSSITMTEMVSLDKVSQMQLNVENKVLLAYIQTDFTFLHKIMEFTFLGKTSPIYMNKCLEDYVMLCGTEIFMNAAGELGDTIEPKDRARLAKCNMPLVVEYLSANRIGTQFDPSLMEARQYENLLESDPDREVGRKMYEIHAEVSQNGTVQPVPISYESIFENGLSMSGASSEELKRHKIVAMRLTSRQSPKNGAVEWDPVVSLLTTFIIMHTPDFLDLDDPGKTTDVQAMFAGLLQRYLRSKRCPEREQIFRDSMLASSYARELSEFKCRAYHRMASKQE